MSTAYSRQKAADAAFFDDWSEWHELDSLPPRPKHVNRTMSDAGYSRYYCLPDVRQQVFELRIPAQAPISNFVRSLPGVYQDPRAGAGFRQVSHARKQQVYWIPAEHHAALRAALPAIKQMVTAWTRKTR